MGNYTPPAAAGGGETLDETLIIGAVANTDSEQNAEIKFRSDHYIGFSDSTSNVTTVDTALRRLCPGVLGATSGGGNGLDLGGMFTEQWGRLDTNQSTGAAGHGAFSPGAWVDTTSSWGGDAHGAWLQQDTSSVSGNGAYGGSANSQHTFECNPVILTKFALSQTSDVGFFVGASAYGANTFSATAAPTTYSAVGIHYIAGTHTNFQFLNNLTSARTHTDTGIAADTDVHYYLCAMLADTSVYHALFDATGVLEAEATVATNVPPSANTSRGFTIGITTNTTAVKSYKFYFAQYFARPNA